MSKKTRPVMIEAMENRVMFDVSLLTETVVSSTLPTAVSDHAALKGVVFVDIANNTGANEKEKATIGVAIATGPLTPVAGQFTFLKSQTTTLSIKNGITKMIKFPINVAKGKLVDGTYSIYGLTTTLSGTSTQSAAAGTLTVHPPIIALSETQLAPKVPATLVAGAKLKTPSDKVIITNSGTDPSTDLLAVKVYATTDGVATDGTLLNSSNKKLTINPGKIGNVTLPLPGISALAAGTYQIVAQVTQLNGTITTADLPSAPTIVITAAGGTGGTGGTTPTTPALSETLDSVTEDYTPEQFDGAAETLTELDTKLTISNSGASTTGPGTFTLFASTSSTFDSTAVQVGQIPLNLGSLVEGGVDKINADFGVSQNFPGTADANGDTNLFIFIQVTDPAGNITMVSDPTAIKFAGFIVG